MKKALAHSKALTHNTASKTPTQTPFTRRARLAGALALLGLTGGLGLAASRPAHTAGGPIAVTVANVPLPTKPTDVAAPSQPFQAHTFYLFSDGYSYATLDSGDSSTDITVPAGKRLIIQSVSLYETNAGGQTLQAYLVTTVNGDTEFYPLPSVPDTGPKFPGATQLVALSSDAGLLPWTVYRKGTVGRNLVNLTVSGYLVDVP